MTKNKKYTFPNTYPEGNYTVRLLTVLKKPLGIVVNNYKYSNQPYENYYWVRLKNGILLKDVSINEIELQEKNL